MAVIRALLENPTKLSFNLVPRALIGLVALLCGNAYIVGINQIYDVKIDEVKLDSFLRTFTHCFYFEQINKPFLPIASKLLSESNAWKVVISCLIIGAISLVSLYSLDSLLINSTCINYL